MGKIRCPIEVAFSAMRDWAQLLSHASEEERAETWELPPEPLFRRIFDNLGDRPACAVLRETYHTCAESKQARCKFVRGLKRLAESGIAYLQRHLSASQVDEASGSVAGSVAGSRHGEDGCVVRSYGLSVLPYRLLPRAPAPARA